MNYITFMITMILILLVFGIIMILEDVIGINVIEAVEKKMAKMGSYLEKRWSL